MPTAVRSAIALTIIAAGIAPATAAVASPDTGGFAAPSAPTVSAVKCVASSDVACGPSRTLVRGGTVRISGNALANASKVVFRGGRGSRDDVSTRPTRRRAGRLDAVVPSRARTGRVVVVDSLGRRASSRGVVK
ncbi:MAG: hypothetical protein ACR2HC_01860, partial [Thermoleophilaceae bacterium]